MQNRNRLTEIEKIHSQRRWKEVGQGKLLPPPYLEAWDEGAQTTMYYIEQICHGYMV